MGHRKAAAVLTLALAAVTTGLVPGATAKAAAPDDLDRFRHQPLKWTACKDAQLTESGAECATLKVPLDYARPQGRTLDLAISRIKATSPAKRRGILQTNPGGPGARGLTMPSDLRQKMSPKVAAAYDVIGMDARGVGESSALNCGLTRASWLRSAGKTRAGFDESWRLARNDAIACWSKYPDVLPYFTTRDTARDMDLVRSVLGERKTSFFGQSYGTFLGATYAQMFPGRVDRLVLDSSLDPVKYGMRMLQDMGPANERAIDDFARWAARNDAEYRLGATPAAVRAAIEGLVRRAEAKPIPIAGFQLDGYLLPYALFAFGSDEAENAQYAGALRQLLDAADGKPVDATPDLRELLTLMFHPQGTGADVDLSATLAVLCGDVAMPRDPEWYRKAIARARPTQPVFGPMHNGPTPCAFWKEKPREKPTKIDNSVPALQIQATGDTHTPYEEGLGMHRAMRGTHLVTVPVRVHTVYLSDHSPCAKKSVDDYLADGRLPARDMACGR
ncbi:alpha/beta hydrolase [Streptomyces sp. CBMA152]|uniref:alpha/beta hydrolase n=1 Tax=Streptomyces sp. CBMA152 TaxID=1896312 RepID=UPI00166075DA|nr:alpha/beta hydrolase [Streptomyces sp. CBMA152]MBD0742889.1 transporter [Streptomyces sp. CBMA152]